MNTGLRACGEKPARNHGKGVARIVNPQARASQHRRIARHDQRRICYIFRLGPQRFIHATCKGERALPPPVKRRQLVHYEICRITR